MKLAALTLLVLFLGVGCADSTRYVRAESMTAAHLSPTDPVYVAMPANGSYEDKAYPKSGKATADAIFNSFLKRSRSVRVASAVEDREAALASAQDKGEKFVAYPTILHWEDRLTELSGRPDRVEVRIEILDAETGAVLDLATIEGKSGLGTFGGDHPQDLLASPIEEFVLSLYKS